MTYKELEQLVLALPPAKAARLVQAVLDNFSSGSEPMDVRERGAVYISIGGSGVMESEVERLMDKLSHLSPARQAEVVDFIEFLHRRELAQGVSRDYARMSEEVFAKVWENDDDALYDKL